MNISSNQMASGSSLVVVYIQIRVWKLRMLANCGCDLDPGTTDLIDEAFFVVHKVDNMT